MFQWEVMDKVTTLCPQTTTFLMRKRAEAVSNRGPSAYQPNALPLDQTGSRTLEPRIVLRLYLWGASVAGYTLLSHNYLQSPKLRLHVSEHETEGGGEGGGGGWVGVRGGEPNFKHWFTTSFLPGGRCRKAMLGVWW